MKAILLIEDNENDAILAQWALQHAGVKNPLEVAASGAEAQEYLESDTLPCLVLLDMNLGDMLGVEVLKFIRTHAREDIRSLCVFILSGLTNDRELIARDVTGSQANAFLNKALAGKPFEVEALLKAAVDHHVELERVING